MKKEEEEAILYGKLWKLITTYEQNLLFALWSFEEAVILWLDFVQVVVDFVVE